MGYDRERVDEMTLALMYLVWHGGKWGTRAWKGFDWDTLDRLYEKGLIGDPKRGEVGAGHGGGDRALREIRLLPWSGESRT